MSVSQPEQGDFSDAEHAMISQMIKAGKSLPDEFWAATMMQELACLCVRNSSALTEMDQAVLIGIGGYLTRQARDEMGA